MELHVYKKWKMEVGCYYKQLNDSTMLFQTITISCLILFCFASVWAGFPERTRDGNKFVVAERPARKVGRNFSTETAESVTEERKLKKENDAINGFFDESLEDDSSKLLDSVFGD